MLCEYCKDDISKQEYWIQFQCKAKRSFEDSKMEYYCNEDCLLNEIGN